MTTDVDAGIEGLLEQARDDEQIADRICALARKALPDLVAAEVAQAIAARSGTLQTAVARLSDLLRGKSAGQRWLLDPARPERLAEILRAASVSLDDFRVGVEILQSGLHPAWPELPCSKEYLVDVVPGLSGGFDELVRRAGEVRPGSVFVIAGARGAGVSTLLRRLEQQGVGVLAEASGLSDVNGVALIRCEAGDVARLREQAKSSKSRLVIGVSIDTPARRRAFDPADARPDVTLGPWGHREIAALVRRLAKSHVGGRLREIRAALWEQVSPLTQWTPLELGYVLRGLADASLPAGSIAQLGSLLTESVARARCATVDPKIVDEAFTALALVVFERSPAGRWPSPLSEASVREVLEGLGEGAHEPIGRPLLRAQALREIAGVRAALESNPKVSPSVREHLRRLESALRPPPPGAIQDALVSAGLIQRGSDGYHVTRMATLATAGNVSWDQLLDRAGDPSLHRVMMAALPRLRDTARALDVFLRRGAARQLLDLRIALAVVARADEPATASDARSVVGTSVALLERHADNPWLTHGDDVADDLRRASARYGAGLSGELEVLDSASRWLELAPASPFQSSVRREPLLPWQHNDAFLEVDATLELPTDWSRALLESALASGLPRAREIVSGTAADDRARRLGARVPIGERLALLSKRPPLTWSEHAAALSHCLSSAPTDESRPRETILDAAVALFSRTDCPEAVPHLAPMLQFDEWLEALCRAHRRDLVEVEWRSAMNAMKQAVGDHGGTMAEGRAGLLARGEDPDHCFALADALAEFDDLEPLRALASFGRDDLVFDPRAPARVRLRALLGERAVSSLVARRDAAGLRELLPAARGEQTVVASAIDAACDGSLDDARWAARELAWWRGIQRVLESADDRRCLELVRRWAADDQAPARESAIRCLVLRRDADDADRIVRWSESSTVVLSLLAEMVGHPSKRVRNAALRWLAQRIDGEKGDPLWPEPKNSDAFASRYYVADRLEQTAKALVEHARSAAPRLLQRLVETLAASPPEDDGRPSPSEPSMRSIFELLVELDAECAREVLERLEARGAAEVASRLAREWCFARPSDVPDAVLRRVGDAGSQGAELLAGRMPREALADFVAGLSDEAWVRRDVVAGETLLGRHPWAAIRALATFAPEVFAQQARERCARLAAGDPTSALAIAEWLVEIDSAAAAEALDLALGARTAAPRRSRKKGGVS